MIEAITYSNEVIVRRNKNYYDVAGTRRFDDDKLPSSSAYTDDSVFGNCSPWQTAAARVTDCGKQELGNAAIDKVVTAARLRRRLAVSACWEARSTRRRSGRSRSCRDWTKWTPLVAVARDVANRRASMPRRAVHSQRGAIDPPETFGRRALRHHPRIRMLALIRRRHHGRDAMAPNTY